MRAMGRWKAALPDHGAVGNILLRQSPDFDPRLYGCAKLSDLFAAVGLFVVDRSPGAA
jgi:OST-HTH/LOTUS domain